MLSVSSTCVLSACGSTTLRLLVKDSSRSRHDASVSLAQCLVYLRRLCMGQRLATASSMHEAALCDCIVYAWGSALRLHPLCVGQRLFTPSLSTSPSPPSSMVAGCNLAVATVDAARCKSASTSFAAVVTRVYQLRVPLSLSAAALSIWLRQRLA